jgi:hypothetical protein
MRLSLVDSIAPKLLDFSTSDDVKEMALGTILTASSSDYDTTANVANWGQAEVIYVSSAQSAVIRPGTIVVQDKNFRIAPSAVAATQANTGQPLLVALSNFAIGSTTEQYGWVLRRGVTPVLYSVAATTGRVFAGTAGAATPTAAAGVQILNAQCLIAGATTFTKNVTTKTGQSLVKVGSLSGIFLGQAVSGTGIPSSSVVAKIDPSGFGFYIGSAIDTLVTATGTATVTGTFTNTGYGIVQWDYPFYQGQIT